MDLRELRERTEIITTHDSLGHILYYNSPMAGYALLPRIPIPGAHHVRKYILVSMRKVLVRVHDS